MKFEDATEYEGVGDILLPDKQGQESTPGLNNHIPKLKPEKPQQRGGQARPSVLEYSVGRLSPARM